jgi:hypothetical protein
VDFFQQIFEVHSYLCSFAWLLSLHDLKGLQFMHNHHVAHRSVMSCIVLKIRLTCLIATAWVSTSWWMDRCIRTVGIPAAILRSVTIVTMWSTTRGLSDPRSIISSILVSLVVTAQMTPLHLSIPSSEETNLYLSFASQPISVTLILRMSTIWAIWYDKISCKWVYDIVLVSYTLNGLPMHRRNQASNSWMPLLLIWSKTSQLNVPQWTKL